MRLGRWAWLMLAAAQVMLAGCGNFWENPNGSGSGDFSLSNSGNITVSPGATTGNTSTITVAPSNSFTGTVALTCSVSGPSGATSATTCSLSPTSVSITDTNSQTATLTAATTSTTTTGAYQITVSGASGGTTETTTVCAEVTTSSATCTATGGASGPFYVLNQKTAQIAAYTINSTTLSAVSGSPYPLSAQPFSMAASPNGFLYVGTLTGIYIYSINATSGQLTLGNSNGVISSDLATTMTVDPSGGWLLDASTATGTVNAIPLDATTGLPSSKTEQTFTLPATTVGQVAVSPDDNNVFVTVGDSGTVVIPFNSGNTDPFATTGTRIPVRNNGGSAISVAIDPSNRLFYVGETLGNSNGSSGGLRVFDYTALPTATEITGSPYASGNLLPNFILPMSSGDTVYVANSAGPSTDGSINEFAVASSGSTYTLTAGPVATAGLLPISMAVDNTGSFLLAVDSSGSPDLEGYTFDTTTAGKLDSAISSSTGTDPVAAISVVAAPMQ